MVRELDSELADIVEIEGKLKISRTFSLVSLSFFRSLKLIGTKLKSPIPKYTLQVMDNQNLQDLFPNNVTIAAGRLFFHFNPKLCYNIIEKLVPFTTDLRNVTTIPHEDVAVNSNGDKVACKCRAMQTMSFNNCMIE